MDLRDRNKVLPPQLKEAESTPLGWGVRGMDNSSVSVTANPVYFGEGVGSGLSSKNKAYGGQTLGVSFIHNGAGEHFLCTE